MLADTLVASCWLTLAPQLSQAQCLKGLAVDVRTCTTETVQDTFWFMTSGVGTLPPTLPFLRHLVARLFG